MLCCHTLIQISANGALSAEDDKIAGTKLALALQTCQERPMPISECCTCDVVCCESDTPISDVAALMRKHHVGAVVVVVKKEGGKNIPVGIVTDRDIVLETVALQVDPGVFVAGDFMTTPAVTVQDDAGFVATLRLMRKHLMRRAVVVTPDGALSGIVSADDIVKLLSIELSLITGAIIEQPVLERRLRK
jgi:CBS domain-containing protein